MPLIRGARLAEVVDTKYMFSKGDFKRTWMNEKEQRWKVKRMYGQLTRDKR